jgi:hypothetical protein
MFAIFGESGMFGKQLHGSVVAIRYSKTILALGMQLSTGNNKKTRLYW